MTRQVAITGLGTVTAAGLDIDALWQAVLAAESCIQPIQGFDASNFKSRIGAEVTGFKANKVVPKHYRKATKVMARDIELAVGAANAAVRDAGIVTPGTDPDQPRTYPGPRMGAHIGATLIAADMDELTLALAESTDADGNFDIGKWGNEGMTHLTPLWMLKYLPNMLACHVTIIHDAQGPSNTITCAEASSALSISESVRVILRNAADSCFCGGGDSKANPMALLRWQLNNRLSTGHNDTPAKAYRPFDAAADGTVFGEAGALVIAEELAMAQQRGATTYAKITGLGVSQTVHPASRNLLPDPEGRSFVTAIRAAIDEAEIDPGQIDLIIPYASAIPAFDAAELVALKTVFGDRLKNIPLWSPKPIIGNTGAAAGAIDIAMAAKIIQTQQLPGRINCSNPIDRDLQLADSQTTQGSFRNVLVFTSSVGGQNVAITLSTID